MKIQLPIEVYEEQIVRAARDNQVIVVAAETGAGKSTLVPLMLLRAGFGRRGMIGVTEPRRIAAISLSEWVASLHGTELGDVIGYQIGGEVREFMPRVTRVKYMTEGILLRELHSDPMLRRYDVVVVDEAHERGVNQDLILALLKQVLARRNDLKVVIMSATIDEQRFADHFGCADDAVIRVPGRVFPVEVRYESETPYSTKDTAKAVVAKIASIVRSGDPGDILVFMPDEKTIRQVCDGVEKEGLGGVRILPLYGSQAPDEQKEVFRRTRERRIIVATNIAETSLTIDGVRHVVDSGLIKAMVYVSASMSALQVVDHSKAGCNQRKGRAGRTQNGVCHCVFAREDFESRDGYTKPELLRMSLDAVLLHLRTLGYTTDSVIELPFLDAPPEKRWREAENRLRVLGALDENGEVTDDGKRMARLPVAPMLARMILNAEQYGCVDEIVTVVAGMTARQVFVRPRGRDEEADKAHACFKDETSDALTLLGVYAKWLRAGENGEKYAWARDNFLSSRALRQIDRNREHILGILEREGVKIGSRNDTELIRKAVAAGLIVNLAIRRGQFSYTWQDQELFIHPGSAMFSEHPPHMIVCAEVVETSKVFARGCSSIDPKWIKELIPEHALDTDLRVERDWTSDIDGSSHKLVAIVSWQGTELYRKEVTELTDGMVVLLAFQIAEGMQTCSSFHPQTRDHYEVWREIRRIKGLGLMDSNSDPRVVEILAGIVRSFVDRLKGATTLEEVRTRDLTIQLEDWVSAEDIDEIQARLEKEAARRAEESERWRRQEEEQRARYATEQQEREAFKAETRERYDACKSRAEAFPRSTWSRKLTQLFNDLRWRLDCLYDNSRTRAELSRLEAMVDSLERDNQQRFDFSEQIREAVLKQFPVCPLCGEKWQEPGIRWLRCSGEHDMNCLLPLAGTESRYFDIGRFTTNRGDVAATIRPNGVRVEIVFETEAGRPRSGRVFRSVEYEPMAVILPEELADDHDEIVEFLAELHDMRAQVAAVVKRERELAAEHGSSRIRRLTFAIIGGKSAVRNGSTVYEAAMAEPYPAAGETWICRVGDMLGGVTTAHPIEQVNIGEAEVAEHRATIEELFPGIPEALLNA